MDTTSLVIVAVVASVVGLTAVLWNVGRRQGHLKRRTESTWSEIASELNLPRSDAGGERRVVGTLGGFEVGVETWKGEGLERSAKSVAWLVSGEKVAPEIGLKSASGWSGMRRSLGGKELKLGDPDFDAAVHVEGPEDATLAAMNAAARMAAVRFVNRGGSLQDGDFSIDLPYELDGASEAVSAVRAMFELAKAMAVPSVPDALLENATKDPCPAVRRRCLEVLAAGQPGSKQALWGLQAGLRDLDPELRLFAAQTLAGEGEARGTLEELVGNAELAGALRATALEGLVQGWPYPAVAPVVGRALAAKAVEVRCAAVRAVGQGRDESKLEALEAMAAAGPVPPLGEALCAAFAALGGLRAEATLLKLVSSESPQIQRAAAAALGEAGTVQAVESLLALAKGVLGGASASAAREAIRAIQSRAGGAGAGQLSVVGETGAEGAVSLQPAPAAPDKVQE